MRARRAGPGVPTIPGMPPLDHRAWGVQDGYHDVGGTWHDTPPATIAAALEAMGAGPDQSTPDAGASTLFVTPGSSPALDGPAMLTTEDGAVLWVEGELPPDLPLGYHTLTRLDDGSPTAVVVSPGRCPLPDDPDLGMGGPALRGPVEGQLGHRRPGRPVHARAMVTDRAGRRPGHGQPAPRRPPGLAAAAEPLLPEQPPVPQPALPAHRGRARRRRRPRSPARGAGRRRAGAERRPPHRP